MGGAGRMDFESETFVLRGISDYGAGKPALRAKSGDAGGGSEVLVTHALRADGFDASEDGTGRGTPLVAVCFDTTQITSKANRSVPKPGDPCHPLAAGAHPPTVAFTCKDHGADAGELSPTLRAMEFDGSHANGGGQVAVAVALRGRDGGATAELGDECGGALRAGGGGGDKAHVLERMAVRRLTPMECERLQGFPDGWTAVTHRGKPAADGPRYKALGNSMAVPCLRWILMRIIEVERIAATLSAPKAQED